MGIGIKKQLSHEKCQTWIKYRTQNPFGRVHQCHRKPVKAGFCNLHTPEAMAAREKHALDVDRKKFQAWEHRFRYKQKLKRGEL